MKKRWILILLCLAVLNGCTKTSSDEGHLPSVPADALPEEAEEVTCITDAEITALIDTYLIYERYTVYDSSSMETDPKVSLVVDARTYNKVKDEAYDTWEEWRAFGESIFCGEAWEERRRNENFIEIDGDTYCSEGAMGWSVSKEYTYRIIESTSDRVVIEMTRSERNPGGEDLEQINIFALHRTENGWRIGEWLQ